MLLPLAEIFSRKFLGQGIPGAGPYAQHLTMWVGLLGAAIAAREGKLLSLATGEFLPKGPIGSVAHIIAGAIGSLVATLFAFGGVALVKSDRLAGDIIASGVPVWISDLVLPFAFGVIALRLAHRASPNWIGRAVAALGIAAGIYVSMHLDIIEGQSLLPWLLVVIFAGVLGAPIFTLLGGIAVFAFLVAGSKPIVLLIKASEELTTSTGLAAIPLFTLAGFLLAEGKSSERLLRVFRAWFGWAPGGTAIAAATLCAFFTLFTGGSGVTILVLGGLLLPTLIKDGYRERFSIGLLTASGSLGLLFPLSLPLMLYGIVAQNVSIEDLFVGGLIPGMLMLGLLALYGIREGIVAKAQRTPFRFKEAGGALWEAKWELFLPVFVLGTFLGGVATLVESAPMAALYTLLVQRFIHKDLPTWGDVMRVMGDCVALVGGVLLILAVAAGLTNYLVDAQIPTQLIDWTQAHIHSHLTFLLALNVFLLLVGTLMDIFSAIVVVVPIIVPVAAAFGVEPVHLGVIFLANLELGYLTPPVGLNLFLASYRFKRPLAEVYSATVPFLLLLLAVVLLVTYVPWFTTVGQRLIG